MDMQVEEYVRADLSRPYAKWFDSLDPEAAAKVSTALLRLSMGNTSNIKWFDGIGEYIIDWGPGYRIYLARHGSRLLILFGGGTKKRQQMDIEHARMLHQEFKQRKAAAGKIPWE